MKAITTYQWKLKYNLNRADDIDTLTGARIAHQGFASFTVSKQATVFGKLSLSPFMEAVYNHTRFGRYSESCGVTALTYKEHAINETKLGVGTEARHQLFIGNTNVLPYARIAYRLDVSDQANVPAQMYYSINPSKIYSLALDKRSTGPVQFALKYGKIQVRSGAPGGIHTDQSFINCSNLLL